MALLETAHPFIVLSMATAIMSLFFYAAKFHLGFTLSYVLLANPAAVLHQVWMLDYLYTEQELIDMGLDPQTFAWEAWATITVTFATFSLVAMFLRQAMEAD